MGGIQGNVTGRKNPPLDERLAYRIPDVVAVSGLSRSKVFALIKRGELPSRLISGCRIVTRQDLMNLLQGE